MVKRTSKASHLELRHQTYYAVLYVPKDVRSIIGKFKFFKSTKTSSLKIAQRQADALVLVWQQEIDRARYKAEDPMIASALGLREELRTHPNRLLVVDVLDDEESRYRREIGDVTADSFRDIATNQQQPLKAFVAGWKDDQTKKGLRQKTIDQSFGDLECLVKVFYTAKLLTPPYVEAWIKQLAAQECLRPSAVNRILGSCRSFLRYLKAIGIVDKTTLDPFVVPSEFKISSKQNSRAANVTIPWKPFKPGEVSQLYRSALADHQQLADLIMLGAYTGARIEELCSLKCSAVNLHDKSFTIVEAKTKAGNREVPLHPKIIERVKTMMSESTDGYILSGLTLNKYDDRSNAIGKRFGRLKKKLGFSDIFVFHSIRKTFTTMLEQNGILENLAADIVGHTKPRDTYGLYSGGATMATKRKAVNKISYDFEIQVSSNKLSQPAKRRKSATKRVEKPSDQLIAPNTTNNPVPDAVQNTPSGVLK